MVQGWIVHKYEPRNIIPQPSGIYDSFRDEIKRYVVDLVDTISAGSEIKDMAIDFANNIYWEPARPSTLAGVCVLMAGSNMGIRFEELLFTISKSQRKMKYSYIKWLETMKNQGTTFCKGEINNAN